MTKYVDIYTDGSCKGNPGPGGWGAIIVDGANENEMSGGEPETTNNRMELTAVISALSSLSQPSNVRIFTDSQYIVNAINQHWLAGWKRRGWRRADGVLLNKELWQELDKLLAKHRVRFFWVKGHSYNEYNNRCDKLATEQSAIYAMMKNFKRR